MNNVKVAVIMGSLTDYKVLKEAEKTLKLLKIKFKTEVVSAHRSPDRMYDFAKTARAQGFAVIIAGAGGAAHLPGMVASLTTLPVIGVPIQVGKLKGLDALLSIAQMPKGIPVACMAVENAQNAALLAARILSLNDPSLVKQLDQLMKENKLKVRSMNKKMRST